MLIGSALGAVSLLLSSGAVAAQAKAPVKLSFDFPVGVTGPLTRDMSNLVNTFNKSHPGIQVTPVYTGSYQQTVARVETDIQSGTPPTLAVLTSTSVYDLLRLGAIAPLDSVAKQGDYYPALLQPEVKGHYYGIPFQRSTVVLYYNKTLFKKAGLNPNVPPKNWTQLVSDAQALQKIGVNGIEIPTDGTCYWEFAPYAIEAGQNLANSNGTQVYFNSSAAKTALNFWMDLSHKYRVEPGGILPWATVPSDFEAGTVGMIVHSSGSLAAILKTAKFQVGEAFMPADHSKYLTDLGGGDFFLFKAASSAQKKAALTFIKWMTSPAQAATWSKETGYVAVTPKAYQEPGMKKFVAAHPQFLVPAEQLQYAQPELATYQLAQVQDTLDSAIQSVLDGQAKVGPALNSAQAQANAILAPYR
jgi:sn-glycerol 3-phosphate transport system substrate-binding protein